MGEIADEIIDRIIRGTGRLRENLKRRELRLRRDDIDTASVERMRQLAELLNENHNQGIPK